MQARRIARELALLGMSQLHEKPEKKAPDLDALMLAAVRTLTSEAQETLESAAAELKQSNRHLMESETRTTNVETARQILAGAIEKTETVINRLGSALEIPEFIQLANQAEVRHYAHELLSTALANVTVVDERLNQAMVAWQLKRLARIDRDILRIAVVEIQFLGVPDRVAINEAVEIAKRYSGDEGFRFINGVLRRVTDQIKQARQSAQPL